MKLTGILLMATLFLWVVCESKPLVINESVVKHRLTTLPGISQDEEVIRANKFIQEAIVWGVIIAIVLGMSAFLFCPFCCYCIAEHCHGTSRGYQNI